MAGQKLETQAIIDGMNLAAAATSSMAAMQVMMSASSGLGALMLEAPKQLASTNVAHLAAASKAVDVLLNDSGSSSGSSGVTKKQMKRLLRLLRRLTKDDAGAPVVT